MKNNEAQYTVDRSEASFHDEWARSTAMDGVLVRESFECITAQENRFAVRLVDKHLLWAPIAYNPFINVYRRMARDIRSPNEHPLTLKDARTIRKVFPNARHREFWLLTLALFFKYYLLDRKDPASCRYWKAIYQETEKSIGWWFRPAERLDSILLRLPLVNLLAWNTLFWGFKEEG